MNILVLASEYPYEKDTNTDRTKVVGYFAKEWVKQGHNVTAIVDSPAFPAFYYSLGNKVKGLLSKKHDVSRAPDRIWTRSFSFDSDGVHVENLPMRKFIPHGRFSKKTIDEQVEKIAGLLSSKSFVPDVVTGHWLNPQAMLVAKLAEKYSAKSALVFHGDYQKKNCEKFDAQRYIDQIDIIGFRSGSAAIQAEEYLSLKRRPFIAASGVPDDYIKKYGDTRVKSFDDTEYKLITAGRLVEYKMIDVSIKAADEAFSDRDYTYKIAGDGPMKNELSELIGSMQLSDRVQLLGQIPRDTLQELMTDSHIFVLISKHETFGLVYLEAMLHGCIVIASRFGGIDGIIEDGVNGFLCEEGNKDELAGILKNISEMKKEELMAISSRAIATAKLYSESYAAERYLKSIIEA